MNTVNNFSTFSINRQNYVITISNMIICQNYLSTFKLVNRQIEKKILSATKNYFLL